MKKIHLLFLLLLFFIPSAFSQDDRELGEVWGFGELVFSMSESDVYDLLKKISTEKTKVKEKEEYSGSKMEITQVKLVGYVFDKCTLSFDSFGLNNIKLSTKVSRSSKMCEELNQMLTNDYGERLAVDVDGSFYNTWSFKNTAYIVLKKDFILNKSKIEIEVQDGIDI